jgi:hypothetical protein
MRGGQQAFPLRGGLDQETPAIFGAPGRAIACLNHESVAAGYQRTEGFERFDGRIAPSDETFYTLTFTAGSTAFVGGTTVTGGTSGATGRIIAAADMLSGSFSGGNAAGILAIHRITGVFVAGEALRVGGVTFATLATVPVLGDPTVDTLHLSWLVAAQTYARSLIQPLDTVGGIRGVLINQFGQVCAFSDLAGQGALYVAGNVGWVHRNLETQLLFTGGAYRPVAGSGFADTITGVTSGATAKVRSIFIDSGSYATSDAKGIYIINTLVGNFLPGEQVRVAVGQIVGIATTAQTAVQLPNGGRYSFRLFNFYATGIPEVYAINRVGQAFEFDGSYIGFISTGMALDMPTKIAEHKNQLFLGFAGGSLQNSVVGNPRSYSGVAGAAEIGVGGDITNLIGNTADVMLIFTTRRIYALTGNDSSDFVLSPQGSDDSDTGAKEFTAQRIGQVVYLDDGGVRSVASGPFFGNFRLGTYTQNVVKELARKKAAGVTAVGSCVIKSKSQYLLFFSDGSGISLFFGLKQPEVMLFTYPFVVSAGPFVGMINNVERVFVGATNGYVYELNKGHELRRRGDSRLPPAPVQRLRRPAAQQAVHDLQGAARCGLRNAARALHQVQRGRWRAAVHHRHRPPRHYLFGPGDEEPQHASRLVRHWLGNHAQRELRLQPIDGEELYTQRGYGDV